MTAKRLLSLIISLCIILTVATIPAMAATSGTCGDNLTWTLDDSGTLTISGTGAMYDYNYSSVPWGSNRNSIQKVVIGIGTTSIGSGAFSGCDSLTSITVDEENEYYSSSPDGVLFNKDKTTIARYPEGKTATTYTIPDSVTTIGKEAFSGCDSLTSITIPDSVTTIGKEAFYGCPLTIVTIGNSVTTIGEWAFSLCSKLTSITIPNSVTTIGNYSFNECYSLTSITIPDSVTTIGSDAFGNCYDLTSITVDAENEYYSSQDGVLFNKDKTTLVKYPEGKTATTYTIPDSVTTIGDNAFYGCPLTSVTICNSVTTIGEWAFSLCSNLTNLTSITIPASVTTIGNSAFLYCDSLTSITVDEGNEYYSSQDGVLFNKNKTTLIEYPAEKTETAYTIPDSVTTISSGAFRFCSKLTSITIPDSVTTTGNCVFEYCDSLTSVTLGDSITTIGNGMFARCDSLTSVTIPDSVTTIESFAFYDCTSLTDVYYNGTEEQKAEISIDSSNSCLTNATWHYVLCEQNGHTYDNNCDTDCNVCGETRTTEHTYSNNCDADCNICGTTRTTPDHTYDNACDDSCNVCGDIREVGGHVYDNAKDTTCNACGAGRELIFYPGGLIYTIENNEVTITGYLACPYQISIPAQIEGYPVTSIGDMAFSNAYYLTSITIPDSVNYISFRAFYNCSSLTSITISDSVTSIGYRAFEGCSSLTSITIPDSVNLIWSAFYNCSSLTSITIPNSVTEIPMDTFSGCSSLETITIPDSVTTIGYGAFSNCTSLTSINIPESVTTIGYGAFSGCSSLVNIAVEEENECYSSKDGVLFNKDKTTLEQYPMGKIKTTYTIPDSVTTIGYGAFSNCTSLTSINIPESVTTINDLAFNRCSSLETITIPNSVTTIGHEVFPTCPNLKNVYYIGTEEQKEAISIGAWNYYLENATWHYFDDTCDITCNECGYIRVVENAPIFAVSNATAKVGDTFTVAVSTKNNVGIVSLKLKVGYDAEMLELVNIEEADFADASFGAITKNPITILWEDVLSDNNTTDGTIALLTFKVKDSAKACDTEITVTYDPEDVYNYGLQNVEFAVENGTISVIEYISGDVNADGEINNKDLGILRRYLNEWEVEIDELASDVNRDGKVNNKDLGLLRRYLNDWDVELK